MCAFYGDTMNFSSSVCGIVAEYNPFHGGHRFHIERTREMLGEHTIIVCAMSGNFVQRGDFALLDKYARAEMAVRGGADLVLELPLAAAISSAEGFVQGAVALLHKIGCDTLSFGAENADISLFLQAADALNALSLTGGSRSGLSFAAQRQQELAGRSPAAAELLSSPNNTLGIEYCRALARFPMRPVAVERRGAGHDEAIPSGGFASASLLRRALREGNEHFCLPYLPEASAEIYRRERERGGAPVSLPESTLLALLRSALFRGELASGTADGFDERLQSAVYSAVSFSDAVEKARTRRFPAARVRRTLLRAALGLAPSASPLPQYARVLALGPRGRALLRRTDGFPLIVKPSTEKRLPDEMQPALRLDAFADDLYDLARPVPLPGGGHYRKTPFYLSEQEGSNQ